MSFRLRDSLSIPGSNLNEDAMAHSDHAALVLDGATPLGEALMPGPSDAAWLAQFGARRLMAHLKDGAEPSEALARAMEDAEKSFEALRKRPAREIWETPCASMMLAVYHSLGPSHPPCLELLWFGDCTALFLKGGICEVIGDGFDKRGQEAERARKLAKEKNLSPAPDLNRPEILEALRIGRNQINSGDYWLFSPDRRASIHVAQRVVDDASSGLLLVATDGFLALATDYDAYDAKGLMEAARDKGLTALGEELRAIENGDALGDKFARFKKSDDATALLIEIM
jgi:hypothetical protein